MKDVNTNCIRPLLAAAAFAACAPAWCQSGSNVQLYGALDQGVEAINGTFANNQSSSVRISNGIITPHWGLRGSEDLGGGMKASFNLEGSFSLDDGTVGLGGRLFGRQAHVDLSGRFGTVSIGRQYTMVRFGWTGANPFGTGNQGLKLLDQRISNPRADNGITYVGTWGGFSAGVNYSTGWDTVNGNPATVAAANCPGESTNRRQCREWSAGAKYESGNWGVATAYERLYGGTSATFGGLTSPDKTDSRFVLTGHMKLRETGALAVGWIRRDNMGTPATPKSDMGWLQAIVPVARNWYLDGMLAELKYKDSANKAVLLNLRARYFLSKRTNLYVTAAHMDNSGTLALSASGSTPALKPVAGGSETSVIAGIVHRF